MLLPVAITLITVSKPVLSHFSSTVLALSCVNAEVLSSGHDLFSSSHAEKITSNNPINNLRGFKVNQVFFHFINTELALLHSDCQSSLVGLSNT
ncbi:hypothetical protein ACFLY2_00735 [Patescibacteria group bacterium]